MGVTLGDVGALSVQECYRSCRDRGLPVGWASLAHSYACPLGPDAGDGWVLMSLAGLKRIDPTLAFATYCELRFTPDNVTGPSGTDVVIPRMLVVGAECIDPGARGDDAPFLVRLADRRLVPSRVVIDRAYNLRDARTGGHVRPGSPWTWQGVLADLWAAAFGPSEPGGAWPVLPSGDPDGIELWQTGALEALCRVLALGGCALALDPVADRFSAVRPGAGDPAHDASLARWDAFRLRDNYPVVPPFAAQPQAVRVLFPYPASSRNYGPPWYAIEKESGPRGFGGTVAVVADDLDATGGGYDPVSDLQAAPDNVADLDARATQRAGDLFRALDGADRQRLSYPLLVSEPGMLPGARVESVRWASLHSGTVTEVRHASRAGRTSRAAERIRDGVTVRNQTYDNVVTEAIAATTYGTATLDARKQGGLVAERLYAGQTSVLLDTAVADANGAGLLIGGTTYPAVAGVLGRGTVWANRDRFLGAGLYLAGGLGASPATKGGEVVGLGAILDGTLDYVIPAAEPGRSLQGSIACGAVFSGVPNAVLGVTTQYPAPAAYARCGYVVTPFSPTGAGTCGAEIAAFSAVKKSGGTYVAFADWHLGPSGGFLAPADGALYACRLQVVQAGYAILSHDWANAQPAYACQLASGGIKFGTTGGDFVGGICVAAGGVMTLAVGTTAVAGAGAAAFLYNNAGVLGAAPLAGAGPPAAPGAAGLIYLDVTDPNNPLLYVGG